MVKRKHTKKGIKKERSINHSRTIPDAEKVLIENFVSFQKIMTNLSVKFDNLATQISKLLELFEISAKVLAEKDYEIEKSNKENAKILEKVENVLEQNKTIARGLSLMHEKISEPPVRNTQTYERPAIRAPQQSPFPPIQKNPMMGGVPEEYHRPIQPNE